MAARVSPSRVSSARTVARSASCSSVTAIIQPNDCLVCLDVPRSGEFDILRVQVGAWSRNQPEESLVIEKDALVAGRYRLIEQVGSGAMGVVWKGQDESLGRTVAIRRLLVRSAVWEGQPEEPFRRAMREARIAARLQHRNAIAMFDVV